MVVGLALLPQVSSHLTPDGISYLSIAQHHLRGDVSAAVNAYWSPLYSWLLVPLLGVGIAPAVAAKLLGIATGVAAWWSVDRLAAVLDTGPVGRLVAGLGAALVALLGALTQVTPDLLVGVAAVLVVTRLVRDQDELAGRLPVGVPLGLLAGGAYLTKLFALPWVVVVLALAAVIGTPARRRQVAVGAAVAGVVVAGWAGVLGLATGEVTVGTAASVNLDHLRPGADGSPVNWAGFAPPPHPEATSSWENPAVAIAAREQGGGGDADAARVGPAGRLADLVRTARSNLGDLVAALLPWAALGALAAVGVLRPGADGAGRRRDGALVLAAAVVWTGGVAATFVQARYLWPALLLLLPVAGTGLMWLAGGRRGRSWTPAVVGLLCVAVAVPATVGQVGAVLGNDSDLPRVTTELRAAVDLDGSDVGSIGGYVETRELCFELGCRFHGTPARAMTDAEKAADLRDSELDHLFLFEPLPRWIDPDDVRFVAVVDDNSLAVLDVRAITAAVDTAG